MTRIAVLDDYQNVALSMADWSAVQAQAEVTVFNRYLDPETELIDLLKDFDVICIMRERSRFPANVLEQLPALKLLITSGAKNAAIDLDAASHEVSDMVSQYLVTREPRSEEAQAPAKKVEGRAS